MAQLCWRGTFIDVVACSTPTTRRSRSHSIPRTVATKDDVFGSERDYIEVLSKSHLASTSKSGSMRLSHGNFWSASTTATTVSFTRSSTENLVCFDNKDAASKRIDASNFWSSSTTASTVPFSAGGYEEQIVAGGVHDFLHDLDSDDESGESPRTVDDVSTEASFPAPVHVNKGSHAHPEFCMKPCIFYAAGRCEVGDNCGYCHFDHEKRPMHLDKRNRMSLKEFTYGELAQLLLPVLQRRAATLAIDASELFDMLTKNVCFEVKERSAVQNRRHQSLARALSSMSFMAIVFALIGRHDAPASVKGDEIWLVINRIRDGCPPNMELS